MSDFGDIDFDFKLERTPPMHGAPKEERIQDVAPGWYNCCYICGKSFEEKYMIRKEYRRETKQGKGWSATTTVFRYVISFCAWCHRSHLEK